MIPELSGQTTEAVRRRLDLTIEAWRRLTHHHPNPKFPDHRVAAAMGVSQSKYSEVMRGSAMRIDVEFINRASDLIGVDANWLLKGWPEGLPPRLRDEIIMLAQRALAGRGRPPRRLSSLC